MNGKSSLKKQIKINQVIKYHFKMIRFYDTVIVLDIVITN